MTKAEVVDSLVDQYRDAKQRLALDLLTRFRGILDDVEHDPMKEMLVGLDKKEQAEFLKQLETEGESASVYVDVPYEAEPVPFAVEEWKKPIANLYRDVCQAIADPTLATRALFERIRDALDTGTNVDDPLLYDVWDDEIDGDAYDYDLFCMLARGMSFLERLEDVGGGDMLGTQADFFSTRAVLILRFYSDLCLYLYPTVEP